MAEWQQRRKKEDTEYAKRTAIYTKCKRFKVVEIEILYGRGKDERGIESGYPIIFEALAQRENGDWHLISEHKKLKTAISAINYLVDKGRPKPKRTKVAKAAKRQKAKRKAKREQKSE
jgi:hypothetical protein